MIDAQMAQQVAAAIKGSGGNNNKSSSTPDDTNDEGSGDENENDPPITNKIRQGWNDYISWLKSKGLAGDASLDKNGLGVKMINQYRKENPDTPITPDLVTPIQKDFGKYRQYALKQIDDGEAMLDPHSGATKENFMKGLSIVDGIPGQRTTSFSYPSGYLRDMKKGETKSALLNSSQTAATQLANIK